MSAAFDPAKDVIDLSRIDGDILTAGVQNFTFIGSAPFSGGAQVRYQLDPTNNDHSVQAALAGDHQLPILPSRSQGLVPLTAANFALTSVSVDGCSGEWRSAVLHQGYDGRRRADGICVFQRSGESLYIVPIVLRLSLRRPCGG